MGKTAPDDLYERDALAWSEEQAAPAILPAECPFQIGDLIVDEPDLEELLGKRASATPAKPARPKRRRA